MNLPLSVLAIFVVLFLVLPILTYMYAPTPPSSTTIVSTTVQYRTITKTIESTPKWALELNESYQAMLAKYKELNSSYSNLLREKEELSNKYEDLNSSYYKLLSKLEEVKRDRDALREKYEELGNKYNELRINYTILQEELSSVRNDLSEIKLKYKDLLSKYNDLLNSYNLLKSYRSSAQEARWYEKEALSRVKSSWFQTKLHLWRIWYATKSGIRAALESEHFDLATAQMFAEMVYRDLSYNADLYRAMIHEWLADHPATSEEELANEIARLFYSLDHEYAFSNVDEPNAQLPLFPIELLAHNLGDCEDHAMLMAALYKTAGFRVRIITIPEHAALSIYLNGRWRFIEATIHDSNGYDPPSGFYSSVNVDQLEEVFLKSNEGMSYYYAEIP